MDIGDLGECKERMLIAKEQGDMEAFHKYYQLFVAGYKELTGEDFEKKMKKLEDEQEQEK